MRGGHTITMAKVHARGATVLAQGRTVAEVEEDDPQTTHYLRIRVRSDRKVLVANVRVTQGPQIGRYEQGGGYRIIGTLAREADPQRFIEKYVARQGKVLA